MSDAKLTSLTELSVPALDDVGYFVDVSDTTDSANGSSRKLTLQRTLALCGLTPGGRLTTESGVPISSSDRTSQGTLYYTPYLHDYIRLYDGTRPKLYLFTERSLSLTMTSGKNYDVFLYDNSGTLTLELSSAWTNDTTRANALAWQSGVGWVKSGSATRLWLGTIRASGTNVTESSFLTTDAPAKSFVWNAYNQFKRGFCVKDSTDSWNYTTATIRQKRGSSNNQIEFVCGMPIAWTATDYAYSVNTGVVFRSNGVGIDSTTAFSGIIQGAAPTGGYGAAHVSGGKGVVAAGYHYIAALERSDATGTSTWYGDIGAPTYFQTGLVAELRY